MRWTSRVLLLSIGLLGAGCAAQPEAGPAAAPEATAAEVEEAAQAQRAGVVAWVQAMPEVSAAQVAVGTGPGGGAAQNVSVTVVREGGGGVDDALAQRIVDRVVEGFGGLSATNVAVRDASEPGYLYIGDIGRID